MNRCTISLINQSSESAVPFSRPISQPACSIRPNQSAIPINQPAGLAWPGPINQPAQPGPAQSAIPDNPAQAASPAEWMNHHFQSASQPGQARPLPASQGSQSVSLWSVSQFSQLASQSCQQVCQSVRSVHSAIQSIQPDNHYSQSAQSNQPASHSAS